MGWKERGWFCGWGRGSPPPHAMTAGKGERQAAFLKQILKQICLQTSGFILL